LFGKRSGKWPFSSGTLLHLFGSCSAAAEAFLKNFGLNPGKTPDYPAFCLLFIFLLCAIWLV
jgi:hypothetical protein